MGIELSEFMTDLPAEKLPILSVLGGGEVNRIMESAPDDEELSYDPNSNVFIGTRLDGVTVTLEDSRHRAVEVSIQGKPGYVRFRLPPEATWEKLCEMVEVAAKALRTLGECY